MGIAAVSAGLMGIGAPAFADSQGNNGINLLDDNNVSVLPIQACNDNVAALLGAVVPIGSPQNAQCTNAPVVDHPVAEN